MLSAGRMMGELAEELAEDLAREWGLLNDLRGWVAWWEAGSEVVVAGRIRASRRRGEGWIERGTSSSGGEGGGEGGRMGESSSQILRVDQS